MTALTTTRPAMPEVPGVDHMFVHLTDGRMHIASIGTGEPVLLLPGIAQTWWQWRGLMGSLASAGYRAIAADLRGDGWSELPIDALTRTRRADDVIALLDTLGLDRVGLVSHDLGSVTAFQLTLAHADRFSAQVMLAVPPPQMRFSLALLPGMRHLWHQEALSIPVLGPALLRGSRLPRHLFTNFSARPLDPEVVALATALLNDAELSEAAGLLCRRMVLPELMRIIGGVYRQERFAMPSLFVFGTEDIGFPPHALRKVFEDPNAIGVDARLALVEDAGHFVIDEQPDATASVILDFFASQKLAVRTPS